MSIQSSLRGTATQPRLRRRPITDWTSPLPSSRGALATKQPSGRVMLPLGCFAALALTGSKFGSFISGRRLSRSCRPLLNQPQQQLAPVRPQFLGGQRAVVIPVGGVETLFDDRQVLVLTQRPVLVGIGLFQHALGNSERSGFLGVQREIVIRISGGEFGLRGDPHFVPIQRAILVGIERGD